MPSTGGSSDTIKSNETLFAVIEALQEFDGMTTAELAEHLGVSRSTAHRHVQTLRDNEYVVKENSEYRLSLRFLDIGGYVRRQRKPYWEIDAKVKQLVRETGELVSLIVEENNYGYFLLRAYGDQAVNTRSHLGKRVYLHHHSGGKAILASFPDERVEAVIQQRGLPGKTNKTVTTREELFEELDRIRDRGYAVDRGEHIEGLWAVGAPITDQSGTVIGGLNVAAPAHRMRDQWLQDELPSLLLGVIEELELNITFS